LHHSRSARIFVSREFSYRKGTCAFINVAIVAIPPTPTQDARKERCLLSWPVLAPDEEEENCFAPEITPRTVRPDITPDRVTRANIAANPRVVTRRFVICTSKLRLASPDRFGMHSLAQTRVRELDSTLQRVSLEKRQKKRTKQKFAKGARCEFWY